MFQFYPENPDQIELITCTCRGSRAVFQFYPENPDQIELITCTCRGSRAVFQFYPENPDQIELITTQEHRLYETSNFYLINSEKEIFYLRKC